MQSKDQIKVSQSCSCQLSSSIELNWQNNLKKSVKEMINNSSFQNQLKRVSKQEAGNVYVYICIDHTTITILASKKKIQGR